MESHKKTLLELEFPAHSPRVGDAIGYVLASVDQYIRPSTILWYLLAWGVAFFGFLIALYVVHTDMIIEQQKAPYQFILEQQKHLEKM